MVPGVSEHVSRGRAAGRDEGGPCAPPYRGRVPSPASPGQGRELLSGVGDPDDTGAPDPALSAALAAYAADPAREPEVLAALAEARLLVPVVAVLGEAETGDDG